MVGFEKPVEKYVKPQKTTSGDFDFTEVDDMLSRDYVQGSIIQMVRNITPVGTSAQQVIPTDGTDLLAINSDGSINVKDFTTFSGSFVATTNATYTVPAGKVFIWMGYFLGPNCTITSSIAGLKVGSGADAVTKVSGGGVLGKLTAGQTLILAGGVNTSVWGFEITL